MSGRSRLSVRTQVRKAVVVGLTHTKSMRGTATSIMVKMQSIDTMGSARPATKFSKNGSERRTLYGFWAMEV